MKRNHEAVEGLKTATTGQIVAYRDQLRDQLAVSVAGGICAGICGLDSKQFREPPTPDTIAELVWGITDAILEHPKAKRGQ